MDPITAGVLSAALFELIKKGAKLTVPKLQDILKDKGWSLQDHTAHHMLKHIPLIPEHHSQNEAALAIHFEASENWKQAMRNILPAENHYSQNINNKADIANQVNVAGGGNTFNFNSTPKQPQEQTTTEEATPVKKS